MKSHELQVKAHKDSKRLGRGIGSGRGKTAGRGTKGQWARTGGGVRPGFEGGQNPLSRRLPKKRGFKALNHTDYQVINIQDLAKFKAGASVDAQALAAIGLIGDAAKPVKLLADGELKSKLTITVDAASASAKAKLDKAGAKLITGE